MSNFSPYQLLHDKIPSLDHIRVFGYLCYASTLSRHRNKFAPRAKPCVFLGYPFQQKGNKLLDLHSHSMFISRDVIFHESIFPFTIDLLNFSSDGVLVSSEFSHSSSVLPKEVADISASHTILHLFHPNLKYNLKLKHNLNLKHILNLKHNLNLQHHPMLPHNLTLKYNLPLNYNLNLTQFLLFPLIVILFLHHI